MKSSPAANPTALSILTEYEPQEPHAHSKNNINYYIHTISYQFQPLTLHSLSRLTISAHQLINSHIFKQFGKYRIIKHIISPSKLILNPVLFKQTY